VASGPRPYLQHPPLCATLIENIGVPAKRVVHIPNGVDTEHFSPAPRLPDSPDIVCVGRMVPDKDHATLLEAFARVLTVVPQARLHLVGQGRLEPSIRARAARPDCHGRVIFLPGDTDLRPILRKARIFVLASASEGLPNVLLEAMACALPVVATRVGGIPELIEDNLNGLLAAPANPESLAAHLVRLLGDHEACIRFGQAGRERVVSDYSHITMVSQHESVYTKLTERRAL
jgi:glycosyltransferase involved in cell wall biosynthesis